VTERCLSLKEWAEGAKLTRADLAEAVRRVERRLFRVTPRERAGPGHQTSRMASLLVSEMAAWPAPKAISHG
jgi:hypothetical protein